MMRVLPYIKKLVPVAACVLMMSAAAPRLRADVCDDIGTLGERWHKVGDYIEKHSDNGKLRKSEAANVRKAAQEIYPATKELADILVQNFNSKKADEARAKSLGKQLQASLEELHALGDGDDWDDVMEIVDKIGAGLTKISDMCADGK